jgi:acetyl-CoA acetyltransferase
VTVEIAGTGIHPFGRFDRATVTDLGAVAVRDALAAADVAGRNGFQAAFCGTAYAGVAAGHKVLDALSLTGGPIVDVEAGCASGAVALMLGAKAVEAGQYDTVLVFGIEKMPRGMIRSTFFEPWREAAGLAATPAYFALRAQRLMFDAGVTKADLAHVVVKNRANGAHNPAAMFRKPVTAEEVLASRVVCEPLHLWMLCTPNEGAAAAVLRRSVPGRSGVRLAAVEVRSHLPGNVLSESTPLSGLARDDIPTPTARAAAAAYEAAGAGPDDLDVVECQDTDAARELLACAELGLCRAEDLPGWLASGASAPGGALPVNMSGGLLSKGEPLGASALGQIAELTAQLRGEAGARQVESARVGLAHTAGRGANASVAVLTV